MQKHELRIPLIIGIILGFPAACLCEELKFADSYEVTNSPSDWSDDPATVEVDGSTLTLTYQTRSGDGFEVVWRLDE